MTTFENTHNIDNDEQVYLSVFASKISPELQAAERKLYNAGYKVVARNTRNNVCESLQVYGSDFHDLFKVKTILGTDYRISLNTNLLQITIK